MIDLNDTLNYCANTSVGIRNQNIEIKVAFAKNVISQKDIPAEFVPIPRSCPEKIFYRINDDGEKQRREYILFENNKFFCVYCLCFSPREINRLIKGIDYVPGCRISNILSVHENEALHKLAIKEFDRINGNDPAQGDIDKPERRNAIKSIVKIIIFIATHGEY